MRTSAFQFCQHSPKIFTIFISSSKWWRDAKCLLPVSESEYKNYLWMCILKLFMRGTFAPFVTVTSHNAVKCAWWPIPANEHQTQAPSSSTKHNDFHLGTHEHGISNLCIQCTALVYRFPKNHEALQNPRRQKDDTKQVHTEDPQILDPYQKSLLKSWQMLRRSKGHYHVHEISPVLLCESTNSAHTITRSF